ncbi:uncharacterized protein RHOBADRAFT_41217 [Rhodotorula graminis WP1]|uniref:Stealth protein CR3 conserved region 3 domain-containing protein n=1 Tax=Rhodotorula graminis (strain WP1) TaxID=578459 RepID=A0A194SD57_RHOGW|nr:uncharacterized protein RHOBADRAFT_41217 [Rhodotorula graminis WP1]KPV78673.1 hypothetical protein RHOBADRAFT_41217 [Rhodotorula graminis WP1]
MRAPAALECAPPPAADARAAHPALFSSGAALPSRPGSPISTSDTDEHEHEHDGEAGDATEPLLPRYRLATADEVVEEKDEARRGRRRRVQRIAVLVIASLVPVGITASLFAATSSCSTAKASRPYESEALSSSMPRLNTSFAPSLAQQYLADPESVNDGVLPFDSTAFDPLYRPVPLEHPLSTSSFASSASCFERYIATGTICTAYDGRWTDEAARPKLDAVWTWVNGSSAELMTSWREEAAQEGARRSRVRRWTRRAMRAVRRRLRGAAVLRHFREHDELRFSVRSVVQSLGASSLSTLHLVVGDTWAFSPADRERLDPDDVSRQLRLAQLPHWLDLSSIAFSEPQVVATTSAPQLLVHPHSEIFKAGPALGASGALAWQQKVLPSFNSLAIESQLANIPSSTSASTAIYLNDDFFLHHQLETTDFASPLAGPVFRLQRDLLVKGVAPENAHEDPEGEWRGLGYSAWLLDQRFGERARPYLVHVAKTLSLPIAREMQQVFLADMTKTAESRFRGRGPSEVQPLFLLTHYTIEKHREALLWSFLVARSDLDRSGTYSHAERRALLSSLGHELDSPSSSHILQTFRRIAFDKPQCGDCIIVLLVGKSGEAGLESFLPPASEGDGAFADEASMGEQQAEALRPQAVGLEGTDWRTIDFSRGLEDEEQGRKPSLRAKCAALIHRYSYTLGSSPAAFESIRHGGDLLSAQLDKLDAAFFALNDDVMGASASSMRDVDERLEKWFEKTWPAPSAWERAQ